MTVNVHNVPIHLLISMVNNSTNPYFLATISTHPDYQIRTAIAKNYYPSKKTLVNISNDSSYRVRASVASNSNTPEEILESLSTDIFETVRENVALNPNIGYSTLVKLSKDYFYNVRRQVIFNPKCDIAIIKSILDFEESPYVLNAIKQVFNISKTDYC